MILVIDFNKLINLKSFFLVFSLTLNKIHQFLDLKFT